MDMQNEIFKRVAIKAGYILYQEKKITAEHYGYICNILGKEEAIQDERHDSL